MAATSQGLTTFASGFVLDWPFHYCLTECTPSEEVLDEDC